MSVRGARSPAQSQMYVPPSRTVSRQSQTTRLPSHALGTNNPADRNSPQASRFSRGTPSSVTQALQPISRQFIPPSRRSEVTPSTQSHLSDVPPSSVQEIPAFPRRQPGNSGTALAQPARIPPPQTEPTPSGPTLDQAPLVQSPPIPPAYRVAPAPPSPPPPPPVSHKPRPVYSLVTVLILRLFFLSQKKTLKRKRCFDLTTRS
jgi:hypothetical protein